jgi:hypothetical protein
MKDLILMTIFLPIGIAVYLYIFTRQKYFAFFVAVSGSSAAIPLFFFLRYDFGQAWYIWIILIIAIIFYLGKKYPEKMKEWEKEF